MANNPKMSRTLEVTIAPGGLLSLEAFGFKGKECETATQDLQKVLGPVHLQVRKAEYYQNTATQPQTQKLGS